MAVPGKDDAIQTLKSWFARDFRYAKWERDVELISFDEKGVVRIRIYTDLHCYAIAAHPGRYYGPNETRLSSFPASYLGCIASTRKPRAGEDWSRGNDLADGMLTEETWHRILADIVSYELVRVQKDPSRSLAPTDGVFIDKGTVVSEPPVLP